jgi:hemolysin type calcium-binding protein
MRGPPPACDSMFGGKGSELLGGGLGNDVLVSGIGLGDSMNGGEGNDLISVWDGDGSAGDTADGGNGNDVCVGDVGDSFQNCEVTITHP